MELQTDKERASKQSVLENVKITPDRPTVRRKKLSSISHTPPGKDEY